MAAVTTRYVDFSGDREISSLTEAARVLNDLHEEWNIRSDKTKSLWFRGQTRFDWDLTPGLYRSDIVSEHEREVVRDFKLRAPRYLSSLPVSELGWISLMQHYGLPTRMLDWSESYLVALFFAVRSTSHDDDAALWAIRPAYLNRWSVGVHSIPTEADPALARYVLPDPHERVREVEADYPMAFRPVWNSERISSQRGAFTIHGRRKESLNDIYVKIAAAGGYAQGVKFKIPRACKGGILEELRLAGVTELSLFPEMSALCREIAERYLF